MAEIASRYLPRIRKGYRQIGRSAADVENLRRGRFDSPRHFADAGAPPPAIEIDRQEMVQEIVSLRDYAEHGAYSSRPVFRSVVVRITAAIVTQF